MVREVSGGRHMGDVVQGVSEGRDESGYSE